MSKRKKPYHKNIILFVLVHNKPSPNINNNQKLAHKSKRRKDAFHCPKHKKLVELTVQKKIAPLKLLASLPLN